MTKLYKNWVLHNLVSHPLSEIAYWFVRPLGEDRAMDLSGKIHDITIPDHEPGTGRG